MSVRIGRMSLGLLLGVLLSSGRLSAQSVAAHAGKSSDARPDVVLTLKIRDGRSGMRLEAKKTVPGGSNALEVMEGMVVVKSRRYPDVGSFVTGLCGVDAPEGMVWTFTIDSEWSKIGIGNVTLERDTVIEWETR
jgi:hypothetical protein